MNKIIFIIFAFILLFSFNLKLFSNNSFEFKLDSIEKYPSNNIFQLVDFLPGFRINNNQIFYRGTLQSDGIRINNIDINDPIYDCLGEVDVTKYPSPSIFAIQSVSISPSTFSVKNKNQNILNMELKTGNTKKFEAFAYYSGAISSLNGSANKDYSISVLNKELKLSEISNGRKLQSNGVKSIDIGFGGPLFFDDQSSFFFSYRNYKRDFDAGLGVYDPQNNNLGQLPNQRTFINNLAGTLNFKLLNDWNFKISGMYGLSSWENSSWYWLYATSISNVSGAMERQAKQRANNYGISNLNVQISKELIRDLNLSLQLGIINHTFESGRKASFGEPSAFSGFDIQKPVDKLKIGIKTLNEPDGFLDYYQSYYIYDKSIDGFLGMEIAQKNPNTGFYEEIGSSNTKNPYGLQSFFGSESRQSESLYFLNNTKYSISLNLNYKNNLFGVNSESNFGVDYSFNSFDKFISIFDDKYPQYYVNSEKYNAGIITSYKDYMRSNSFETLKPYDFSVYIDHLLKINSFEIYLGVRGNYHNISNKFSVYDLKVPKDFLSFSDSTMVSLDGYFNLNPRMTISYLLNNNNSFALSYGNYSKNLNFSYLYFCISPQNGNFPFSNPNLNPESTNTLQFTYSGNILDGLILDIAYFKSWVSNYVSQVFVHATPYPYTIYTNDKDLKVDFQGFDFSIKKNLFDNLSLAFNGSYSTTSKAFGNDLSSTNIQNNWLNFAGLMNYSIRNNGGISFFGFNPFQNFEVSLIGKFKSGEHYTKLDNNGMMISEYNSEQLPNQFYVDLRVSKKFYINNSNTSKTNNMFIAFTFDCFNILNTSYQNYYSDREKSIALSRKSTNIGSSTPYYEKGDYTKPETFSVSQYDKLGFRLYNKNADYNTDGIVTQNERFQSYCRYLQDTFNQQKDMSQLRTAFFNISVGF